MKFLSILAFLAVVLTGCQSTSNLGTSSRDTAQYGTSKSQTAQIRTALAGQYISERKLDDAKAQLEMAFRADSRYAPAYDMMGNLLSEEGSQINLAKADEYFKRALSIDPNFTQARNNYGVYLSKMGRHKEAIEQFNIASSTLGYKGRASSLENLGLTYLKLGDEKSAENAFNRALEIDTNLVLAKMELIDILINQKRTLLAKEHYDSLRALWQMHNEPMSARLMYQGLKLSILQNNPQERQRLSGLLLSQYPLSDEAKKLKTWLNNPSGAPLK
ncbi:MAG: tetratricopeptide repeat protein [Moraxella sp.]|nr:tetratricopeptide repeat protein [Moraxella sp.]